MRAVPAHGAFRLIGKQLPAYQNPRAATPAAANVYNSPRRPRRRGASHPVPPVTRGIKSQPRSVHPWCSPRPENCMAFPAPPNLVENHRARKTLHVVPKSLGTARRQTAWVFLRGHYGITDASELRGRAPRFPLEIFA